MPTQTLKASSMPQTAGAKRDQPEEPEPPANVASTALSPSPTATKKSKTNPTTSPSPFNPNSARYPSIAATTIRTLKWGHARDLMLPLLSEEDKANIHKKTRADLAELVQARINAGDITARRFWDVVGPRKVPQPKERKKHPADPGAAAALLNIGRAGPAVAGASTTNATTTTGKGRSDKTPTTQKPAFPGSMPVRPGMPYPRPNHIASGRSPPGPPPMPMPFIPLPRPVFKYTLRVPVSVWPSTKYAPGIVVGEPIPPTPLAPPAVTGTFHSSGILAIGANDEVYERNSCKMQTGYILGRLDMLLRTLNATHADILSMTAHVVDIHKNGEEVQSACGTFMAVKGKPARSVCSWTMLGVSGLMPKGCVVQLEVKAIVRRGLATALILDRSQGVNLTAKV